MFYSFAKALLKVILSIFYGFKVTGLENIPANGKLIICSNHASNWDPVFISLIFPRQVHWMAKKELFKNKILSYIIYKLESFPVDRHETDITAIKNALRVLKNEKVLGIFPEGTRVEGFDIANAKPGVSLLAIKSQATILPISISSSYKIFNKVNINIGKPFNLSDYYGKRLDNNEHTQISINILEKIYELKK